MIKFFVFAILLGVVAGTLGIVGYRMSQSDYTVAEISPKHKKIIIDAGHGGMDGGATGINGVLEKDLNLTLSKKCADLFALCGYEVILTRETDISLGEEEAAKGKRKMTDLVKRLEIAKDNPDAIFLSIHMNKFPQEGCHGFQLWYSSNNEQSRRLADIMKTAVKNNIQPDNNRECKKATSSIYLLDRMKNVSVLAECGFISNAEECTALCENSYQNKLAACFFYSVNDFYENVG